MEESNIQKGLNIFTYEWDAWDLTAEHDQVWVYPVVPKEHKSNPYEYQEKKEQEISDNPNLVTLLEDLGWFKESDMGWSHFT